MKANSPFSENVRHALARNYALHFQQEVLPLIYSMPEHEQLQALAFETKRLLENYEKHLSDACDRFQEFAQETIALNLKPSLWKP